MAQLYDDSSEEEDTQFKVNKDFAEKFEVKKRTEELSKLQDKYGADYTLSDEEDEEEDLSSDDSDAEFVTPQVDVAILRTLSRIRKKDPTVYEDGRQVFEEEEGRISVVGTLNTKAKPSTSNHKPILLKDYQRSQMLADPTNSLPHDISNGEFLPTFAQEESALKAETTKVFHSVANSHNENDDDDEDDDLLVPREKTLDEREKEDAEYQKFLSANVGDRAIEDVLEQEEKFLRDYIVNRGWIDRTGNKSRIPSYNEITGTSPEPPSKKQKTPKRVQASDETVDETMKPIDPGAHDSSDSEFEEKADDFEQKYNFRFEEEAGPTILTHARNTTKTARKATTTATARARAREAAKEKAAEEKVQRKEEVRRLKALKRKEVAEKVKKLMAVAGQGVDKEQLDGLDLDGDWDEQEHDRKMREVYGEDYDGVDDDGFKPTWDDDVDVGDLDGDTSDGGDEKIKVNIPIGYRQGEPKDSKILDGKSSQKGKDKMPKRARDDLDNALSDHLLRQFEGDENDERKKTVEKLVDEYYALDYEDKIGDLQTRFKYTKVQPSSFALTPTEILLATDAELNSYVALRKFAPYRSAGDAEMKASKAKKRLKELRDSLKTRKWGEESLEEDTYSGNSGKIKWSQVNGRAKNERGKKSDRSPGTAETEGKTKRIGKKERERRKKTAEGGIAQASLEEGILNPAA